MRLLTRDLILKMRGKEGQGSCSNNSMDSETFSWKELDLAKPELKFTYGRRKFSSNFDGRPNRYMFKYSRKRSRLIELVARKYTYLYDRSSYESETSSTAIVLPSSDEPRKFPDACIFALPVSMCANGSSQNNAQGERRTQSLNDLQNGHIYCKKSRELFENIERKASAHKIIPYNEQRGIFEVITARYKTNKGYWKGGNKQTIDLHKGYCSCGKWSRYHSPCSHIVAGCLTCNLDWKQYIESSHSLTGLYEMWKHEFHPISHQAYWTFPLASNWENYGTLLPDENLKKKKNK